MFSWIIPALFLIAAAITFAGGTKECFVAAMTTDDDKMNGGIAWLAFSTIFGGIFVALVA